MSEVSTSKYPDDDGSFPTTSARGSGQALLASVLQAASHYLWRLPSSIAFYARCRQLFIERHCRYARHSPHYPNYSCILWAHARLHLEITAQQQARNNAAHARSSSCVHSSCIGVIGSVTVALVFGKLEPRLFWSNLEIVILQWFSRFP